MAIRGGTKTDQNVRDRIGINACLCVFLDSTMLSLKNCS